MPGRPIQLFALIGVIALIVAVACAGPERRDDTDATSPPAVPPTDAAAAASPSITSDEASNPTREDATPTPIEVASPTPSPVSEAATPTVEPTATATVTATPIPISLDDSLPGTEDLPGEGFFLANQGTLTALDLANSYQDASAHLERLDNWGFKEHVFREYSRDLTGPDDPIPGYVLTTVNEYGSGDQAADALDWLRSLNASQGQVFVDPDPDLGDGAFASSVETADGSSTAIVYVQIGARVYAYFAQGGEPLDFVLELSTDNTQKIMDAG
ncbi:hypothetical protein BH23CHL2_BH23CHL2_09620 [soil metagenome]